LLYFFAVLGASASGKSLLLRAIAGRVQDLNITGELLLKGSMVNPKDGSNPIGYVPQDDFLIGELSARETWRHTALMKKNKPPAEVEKDVENLLQSFGLSAVADNAIGTIFVRGLSGGQKKRVEVGSELISAPLVLLLDEPTSGLDGSIAFEVLNSIKSILKESKGQLSIIISIHQPNSRILELFDHILLIGGGGMLFFGTVPESIDYFSSIGYPPPHDYTPTDYFLQLTDKNFGTVQDMDFEGCFSSSKYNAKLEKFIDAARNNQIKSLFAGGKSSHPHLPAHKVDALENGSGNGTADQVVPFLYEPDDEFSTSTASRDFSNWRRFTTLLSREIILAARDPSLYYFQFVLILVFGFLVGSVFLDLKYEINNRTQDVSAAVLWLVLMMIYIQIFKVFHMSRGDRRFQHERCNQVYGVIPYFCAELVSTAVLLVTVLPGTSIGYFMAGLPNKSYPFLMLLFWMVSWGDVRILTGRAEILFALACECVNCLIPPSPFFVLAQR